MKKELLEKIYENDHGYVCNVKIDDGKVIKGFFTYEEIEDMKKEVNDIDDIDDDIDDINDDIDMIIKECEVLRDNDDENVRDKINEMIVDLYKNINYDHKEILNVLVNKIDKYLDDEFIYNMIEYIINGEEYVEY